MGNFVSQDALARRPKCSMALDLALYVLPVDPVSRGSSARPVFVFVRCVIAASAAPAAAAAATTHSMRACITRHASTRVRHVFGRSRTTADVDRIADPDASSVRVAMRCARRSDDDQNSWRRESSSSKNTPRRRGRWWGNHRRGFAKEIIESAGKQRVRETVVFTAWRCPSRARASRGRDDRTRDAVVSGGGGGEPGTGRRGRAVGVRAREEHALRRATDSRARATRGVRRRATMREDASRARRRETGTRAHARRDSHVSRRPDVAQGGFRSLRVRCV